MFVCHKCDNPGCVNLDHLFLGTPQDNARDMIAKGRANMTRVHQGHRNPRAKLTEETAIAAMARLLCGESQASVARGFGVGPTTITNLWSGRSWSHLFSPLADAEPDR